MPRFWFCLKRYLNCKSEALDPKAGCSRSTAPQAPADDKQGNGGSCPKCGELFDDWEAVQEEHHLSKHAVTELPEGDFDRQIIEGICRLTWLKPELSGRRIERVFRVHNSHRAVAQFEEYRDMVKSRAATASPRCSNQCLTNGNEILRFYLTTVTCSLGTNGPSRLCTSEACGVCRIIRGGFSSIEAIKGGIGIYTTSTSAGASQNIEVLEEDPSIKKVLLACTAIAGRIFEPVRHLKEFNRQPGFDSIGRKAGFYKKIEELFFPNTRALLPCFVLVIQM